MAEKRLAVVTGAARGIGRAIVLELLEKGRVVAGIDINAGQLAELEKVVADAGHTVVTRCVDITKTDEFAEVLEALAAEHGGIGILVNNAGITRDKLMMQMKDEDFDSVINVNLRAAFMATTVALRSMVRNKFGRIVNMSSVAGVMGQAGSSNYAASKAGLIGMTKSVAREVGKKNVTANCIAPGNARIRSRTVTFLQAVRIRNSLGSMPLVMFVANSRCMYAANISHCPLNRQIHQKQQAPSSSILFGRHVGASRLPPDTLTGKDTLLSLEDRHRRRRLLRHMPGSRCPRLSLLLQKHQHRPRCH